MSEAAADLIDRLLSSDEPDTALDLDVDAFMFPHDPQPSDGATRYPDNPVSPGGRVIQAVTADVVAATAALVAVGADAASLHAIALSDLGITGGEDHPAPKIARRMVAWYLRNLETREPEDAE